MKRTRTAAAVSAAGLAAAALVTLGTAALADATAAPGRNQVAGMDRMHEQMRAGNPGMDRMHEQMTDDHRD